MKLLKRAALILSVLVMVLYFYGGRNAHAISLGIELFDGSTTVTVWDGGAGDLNSSPGVVMYSGTIGNWTINVTTAIGYPNLGTISKPILDLNSVDASSAAGGSLTVKVTETDLGPLTPGISSITTSVGGVTAGTVSFQTYYNALNTPFGTGTLIASLGPYYNGAFSDTVVDYNVTIQNPFSLTAIANITHAGQGSTSFNDEVSVPEPATLLLLGSGLLGIGLIGRRRLNKVR